MRIANKVVLASLNREKLEEFQALLADFPQLELVPAEDLIRNPEGLSTVENFDTYLDNAVAKARLANQASHYPSLADDSGLEVEALQRKPGVRSHRYAKPQAGKSQDQSNVELLLSELKSSQNRSARFVCTLALVVEGVLIHSTGILEGTIIDSPRGTHGFGYDPIFVPKGANKTLAEMTQAEKNAISHRHLAVQKLLESMKAHGLVLAKP
jgi:XTP/dITP diphosphohydrolase